VATTGQGAKGQVLEREVVDGGDDGTGREGRRRILDVQEVNGATTQFSGEREGDAYERRVRQSAAHGDVGPASGEAFVSLLLRHVDGVAVLAVQRGQRLDEVRRISLVAGEPCADRVRVNRNVHRRRVIPQKIPEAGG
jgi:hypothetical protein